MPGLAQDSIQALHQPTTALQLHLTSLFNELYEVLEVLSLFKCSISHTIQQSRWYTDGVHFAAVYSICILLPVTLLRKVIQP